MNDESSTRLSFKRPLLLLMACSSEASRARHVRIPLDLHSKYGMKRFSSALVGLQSIIMPFQMPEIVEADRSLCILFDPHSHQSTRES
jgi:hypothetical protein